MMNAIHLCISAKVNTHITPKQVLNIYQMDNPVVVNDIGQSTLLSLQERATANH